MEQQEGRGGDSRWILALGVLLIVCVYYWPQISPLLTSFSQATGSIASVSQADIAYPVQSAAGNSLLGKPTISASFINHVLYEANSPAQGTGQALYEAAASRGIDPAYALAFFLHEDSYGKAGWGAANHSMGNIRCSQGYACGGGYRAYPSWAASYEDWVNLMYYGYIKGGVSRLCPCMTVQQIAPIYAPSRDHNDPVGYVNAVVSAVQAYRAGRTV